MDLYDEPTLALGGRIVRAGGLPYLDFYTHYGPLGYSLIAVFLGVGNPGIACRLAQALALLVVAVPLVPLARRLASSGAASAALAALLLLNFSAALAFPHFLAYTFALLAIELIALAEIDPASPSANPLWLGAGAAAGLAGLVRPAFGVYTVARGRGLRRRDAGDGARAAAGPVSRSRGRHGRRGLGRSLSRDPSRRRLVRDVRRPRESSRRGKRGFCPRHCFRFL